MMDMGMAYLTLGAIDPVEAIRAAGAAGFRHAGVRLTNHKPGDDWPIDITKPDDLRRLAAASAEHDVSLVNACTYRIDPATPAQAYQPVLEACATLGIPTLIANCFADIDVATKILHDIASRAAPLNVRIAIEFIPVSAIRSLQEAETVAKAAGLNVGIALDALHLYRSGQTPAAIAEVDPARLFVCQLCDGPLTLELGVDPKEEMRTGRLLPGEGEFDLAAIVDHLPEGIELEIEAPNASFDALPPEMKARLSYVSAASFLSGYRASQAPRT